MSAVGKSLRKDFPFFQDKRTHAYRHYLDNAATTQRPQVMLDALTNYYTAYNANVGRGVYTLAEESTQRYYDARATVARYMGAKPVETIFVPSATYGINMLAYAWEPLLKAGDTIVVTQLEHHANFIPWLMLAQRTGAQLRVIPVDACGQVCTELCEQYIDASTKIVAISSMSNVTGLPVPLEPLIAAARAVGAKTLIDACQSAPLGPFNVREYGCDALVFSGHKVGGPTAIGVLFLHEDLHQDTPPAIFGGGMVREVSDPSMVNGLHLECPIITREAPECYEAGTPPVAQAVGLAAALTYMQSLDLPAMHTHYQRCMEHLINGLAANERITIIGDQVMLAQQAHVLSFTVNGLHAHDVAAFLSESGVSVRAGDHCAHPLARALGVHATVRVSMFVYNDLDDIEVLLEAIARLPRV